MMSTLSCIQLPNYIWRYRIFKMSHTKKKILGLKSFHRCSVCSLSPYDSYSRHTILFSNSHLFLFFRHLWHL